MKKILFAFLLNTLVCFSCFALEGPKFLECKNTQNIIENRLGLLSENLVDFNKWKVTNKKGFFMVAFGKDWEEVEDLCYTYVTYVEVEERVREEPYLSESECNKGFFTQNEHRLIDEFGGYFFRKMTNSYNKETRTCSMKNDGGFVNGPVVKQPWTFRKTCDDSWNFFVRSIMDEEFNKEGHAKMWQKEMCHPVTKEYFEKETGYNAKELMDKFGMDAFDGEI